MWSSNWTLALLAGFCLTMTAHPPAAAQADPPRPGDSRPDSLAFQTREGFAACTSRDRLHQMMTHVAERQSEAYRQMLQDRNSGCFLLKQGVEVVPLGYNTVYVEVRPVGMKGSIWTVVEAIEQKRAQGESAS